MGSKSGKKSGRGGGVFLVLFGLPFAGVGVFMGWMAGSTLLDYARAQHWTEVPATIDTLDLEHHSDSEGGSTSKVVCTYHYTIGGTTYTADRVGINGSGDNIGSWHEDVHRRLRAHHQRGKTVTCYVNPAAPEQAMLDRELRFGLLAFMLLFVVVFGGAGGSIIYAGITGGRRVAREKAAQAAHPDQPWLTRPEWSSGRISPQLGRKAAMLWVFALFWNAISSPILFFLPEEIADKHNYLALIGLLFPAVGAGILAWAIRATLMYRRFGRSYLNLSTLPGVVGGRLQGELVLVGDIAALDRIDVTLKCVRTVTTQSGDSSDTNHHTLWGDTQTHDNIAPRYGETEVRLPVDFQIPYTCEPCDDGDSNNRVHWQLTADADIPGVNLGLCLEVPVYRTADSDEAVGEAPERVLREQATITAGDAPISSRIRVETLGRTATAYTTSCWAGFGMFLLLLVVEAIFTGATGFMAYAAWNGNWFLILFLIFFAPITLVLWCILPSLFGSYRTVVSSDGVEVTRRLGPFTRTKTARAADITNLYHKQSMSSGDRQWFRVDVELANGRRLTLAGSVYGELNARWLVHQVSEAITVPPGQPRSLRERHRARREREAEKPLVGTGSHRE